MRGHLHDIGEGLRVFTRHAADVVRDEAFLLHLGDHPLEDVAAADGLENFTADALGHAVQTLLHEHLALNANNTTGAWPSATGDVACTTCSVAPLTRVRLSIEGLKKKLGIGLRTG